MKIRVGFVSNSSSTSYVAEDTAEYLVDSIVEDLCVKDWSDRSEEEQKAFVKKWVERFQVLKLI